MKPNKRGKKKQRRRPGPKGRRTAGIPNFHSDLRVAIPRQVRGGIPDQIRMTLPYVDEIALTASTGATSANWGLNCLYDPYLGTGGHQPSNFDFWMQQYMNYCVTAVAVKMEYCTTTTSAATPAAYGFLVSSEGNVVQPTTPLHMLLEQRNCIGSRIGSGIVNGPNPTVLRGNLNVGKWFGLSPRGLIGQSEYRGTSAANPATVLYLEVWASTIMGNNAAAGQYRLTIDYDVTFTRPLEQLLSNADAWNHRPFRRIGPGGIPILEEQKQVVLNDYDKTG